jgi:CubicO group peptidase (beta-lactamase class C family)
MPLAATLLRRSVPTPPGGNVVYVDEDGAVSASFGYADRELQLPMTTHTLYPLASWIKPIFGVVVLQMEERGLIRSVNDKIINHLGPTTTLDVTDSRARQVTFRQILTHRSGIARATEPVPGSNAGRLVFVHEPGTKYNYANAPFGLIAQAVEHVTGAPFEQWVREQICEPLKISDMHFFPNVHYARIVHGYYEEPAGSALMMPSHPLVKEFPLAFATPVAMAQLASFFLFGDPDVLSDWSRSALFTPITGNSRAAQSLGFELQYPNSWSVHARHDASETGPRMDLLLDPRVGRGVLTFFNAKGAAEFEMWAKLLLDAFTNAALAESLSPKRKNGDLLRTVGGSWTSDEAGGGGVMGLFGDRLVFCETFSELDHNPNEWHDQGLDEQGSRVLSSHPNGEGELRIFKPDGSQWQGTNQLRRTEYIAAKRWRLEHQGRDPDLDRIDITEHPIHSRGFDPEWASTLPVGKTALLYLD